MGNQQGITQNTVTIMYRVQGTMMENYYGDEVQQRKSNLDAPRVTINNHRMTNVQLPGGDVVQGIRRNNDLGHDGAPQAAFEPPQPMKPLRYTPGMKCDAALEAMRPERLMKHQAIQGGDQWKKKLIQTPQTYEGSFADADMQQFRPHPTPNPMNDQWFVSRLPDQPMGYVDMGGYPSDQLSQIKMRNRRFQQSCAMEGMQGGFAPPPAPMMRGPVYGPPPMMMQRQCQMLEQMPEQPIRAPRFQCDEFLSADMLPAPKRIEPKKQEPEPAPKPAPRREVGIADQIAIRSYVLGKSIGKTSASE